MRYIYKNITKSLHLLSLASAQRNSVSHIPLASNATIELSYPGLDLYLPHILARINESGTDITATVLRNNAANVPAVKPVVPQAPAAPKVVNTAGNPTAVQPGINVPAKEAAPVVPAPAVVAPVTPTPVETETPVATTTTASTKGK